jgi:hypothetical protein
MVKVIGILLFGLHVLDGELKFALDLAQEHVIDEDVVIFLVELVLHPDEFELVSHVC